MDEFIHFRALWYDNMLCRDLYSFGRPGSQPKVSSPIRQMRNGIQFHGSLIGVGVEAGHFKWIRLWLRFTARHWKGWFQESRVTWFSTHRKAPADIGEERL